MGRGRVKCVAVVWRAHKGVWPYQVDEALDEALLACFASQEIVLPSHLHLSLA